MYSFVLMKPVIGNIYGIVAVLGVVNNLWLIVCILHHPHLRTTTNLGFVSSSVNDLLTGAVLLPVYIILMILNIQLRTI